MMMGHVLFHADPAFSGTGGQPLVVQDLMMKVELGVYDANQLIK